MIVVTDPATGQLFTRGKKADGTASPYTWGSLLANGRTDPGALQVEIDAPTGPYAMPNGNMATFVRIWGVSLLDIAQATDLNGKDIAVYAGMSKGLPLANPTQAGLIVSGSILQAYGLWQDTAQHLDLLLGYAAGKPDSPANLVLNWPAGTHLAEALASTLSTAFPKLKQDIKISPDLVLSHDSPGYYATLGQFATFVQGISRGIIGKPNYPGVDIVVTGTTITVTDGTTPEKPTDIAFTDLIGQPTWIGSPMISFVTVMRADIKLMGYVRLPVTATVTTPAALSQFKNKSVFQGVFRVQSIRHIGNFRQPDASSWVTMFEAYPVGAAG